MTGEIEGSLWDLDPQTPIKRCIECGLTKHLTAFPFWKDQPRGNRCKECIARYSVKYNYGVSTDEFVTFLEDQDGLCAICRGKIPTARPLGLDHDHKTGEPRGLLCAPCNKTLGLFQDDPELFIAAAKYLLERQGIARTLRIGARIAPDGTERLF
jgi:hypothetical protein